MNNFNQFCNENLPGPLMSAWISRISLSLIIYWIPVEKVRNMREILETVRRSFDNFTDLFLNNHNNSRVDLEVAVLKGMRRKKTWN